MGEESTAVTVPEWVGAYRARIDHRLEEIIHREARPEVLTRAMKHAVLSGGKRLRPMLTLLCAEVAGGSVESALDAACAVELVHAFSLVHDDLPAMDDDDMRRGQPTVHIRFGEGTAILTGDALLALAFAVINAMDAPAETRIALTTELADATGRMVDGQVLDTSEDGSHLEDLSDAEAIAELKRIHGAKTGALITAACRLGAISSGATDAALAAVTNFGDHAGLMFQVVDDLLDVTVSSDQLGKRSRKDHAAGKLTFPGVLGIDGSRAEVARLLDGCRASLGVFGSSGDRLLELSMYLASRSE